MKNVETKQPNWWTTQHSSAWDRVKEAFRRDWEQTKADLSKTKGEELNQSAGDTIKQAAGKESIPPEHVANPDSEWGRYEPALRYGHGARSQYPTESKWNDQLEQTMERDWKAIGSEMTWRDVRSHVRQGFEHEQPDSVGSDGPDALPDSKTRKPMITDSSNLHRRP